MPSFQMQGQHDTPWHARESEEVLAALESTADKGLSEEEARQRLEAYGKNEIPEPPRKSALMRLLLQFHNVLIYLLLVAALITALMDHLIDTGVILGVVIINAVVGFLQEGKAEKALDGIRKMLSLRAVVLREGSRHDVAAELLVPGDIVFLKSGDKIPADLRIIRATNLRIEESPLTGESTEVNKTDKPVSENAVPGDRTSMLFSGTAVTYGSATGVVTATGADTELGKINRMISEVQQITTPLLQQISRFGIQLSAIIIVVTALFFLFGYFFREYQLDELFMAVIGLAVAAIPEGLPAVMTITLATGVQRMAGRNAIIRRLPSVETLGTVSVICSDKTGTLTRNEMTAKTVVTASSQYDVDGAGYSPEGAITGKDQAAAPDGDPVLKRLLQCFSACNDADISRDESGRWILTGAPTEGALMTLARKGGQDSASYPRKDVIPFESEHKYMATLNAVEQETVLFVKGAPERLLERCTHQEAKNGAEPIDRDAWEKTIEDLAGSGQRVIAGAFRIMPAGTGRIEHADLDEGLHFLGVVGIIDPPRTEAVVAVQECREAGITVKMITGDHALTARSIGKELGIGDGEKVITGAELEVMDDRDLREAVLDYDVFARTSPEHKLRLVKALQANGLLCAMTGDGVNDAPALKQANIGIAMGIKGTEVTKEASEMVLADDNFATIVHAVEEGRTVYDNLRKALLFILPTNGAESLVLMTAILMGIAMPITPVQVLWVNMVTAITLALALSFEPMEHKVMEIPPRDPGEPLLGAYFLWRIAFVSILIGGLALLVYKLMKGDGASIEISRTVAVNTLVAGQGFYLFNCRKIHGSVFSGDFFGNRVVFLTVGVLVIFQLVFTYAPFMHTLFGTAPMDTANWIYPLVAGVLVFTVVEIEKYIFNRIRPFDNTENDF